MAPHQPHAPWHVDGGAAAPSAPPPPTSPSSDVPPSSSRPPPPPPTDPSPFRVLGVALVVEEPGRGARLVFRYPPSPPPIASASASAAAAAPPSHPPHVGSAGEGGGTVGAGAAHPTGHRAGPAAAADAAAADDPRTPGRRPPPSAPPPRPASPRPGAPSAVAAAAVAAGAGGAAPAAASHRRSPGAPAQQRPHPHQQHQHHHHHSPSQQHPPSCELFFALPPRVMAKLFRPKPPLCGQPMTLSVGGTVFCCRAVLLTGSQSGGGTGGGVGGGGLGSLQHQQSRDDGDASAATGDAAAAAAAAASGPSGGGGGGGGGSGGAGQHSLVLFSVIVALAPLRDFGKTFRLEHSGPHGHHGHHRHGHDGHGHHGHGGGRARPSSPPSPQRDSSQMSSSTGGGHHRPGCGTASASFLAIRRVHLSLSRLCRALEREEGRCSYVSRQALLMARTKAEVFPPGGGGGGGRDSSGGSDGKKAPARPRHVRAASSNAMPATPLQVDRGGGSDPGGAPGASGRGGLGAGADLERRRRERESQQAVIELMFSAGTPPAADGDGGGDERAYRGNLARELGQTFHALSRNDAAFLPAPSALLGARDGIVYVNGHIAVPVEPASGHLRAVGDEASIGAAAHHPHHHPQGDLGRSAISYLRPYHTLLFPHASPADLLRASSNPQAAPSPPPPLMGTLPFATANVSPHHHSQRLQRLLLMMAPTKTIADAALPLPLAMELASHLVDSGTCVLSHVVGRTTRFAVDHDGVARMRSLALPFAQRFGRAVPIFMAAAALAPGGTTLGEAMESVADGTDPSGIGDRIVASLSASGGGGGGLGGTFDGAAGAGGGAVGGGGGGGVLPPRLRLVPRHSEASALRGVDRGGRGGPTVAGGRPRGGSLGEEVPRNLPLSPHGGSMAGGGGNSSWVRDVLYDMALWLRSHSVIVEVREYLAAVDPTGDSPSLPPDPGHEAAGDGEDMGETDRMGSSSAQWNAASSLPSAPTWAAGHDAAGFRDEAIHRELLEAGCLHGNISTTALRWKFGLEAWRLQRLRDWGLRERRLEFISRIPAPGDDWGSP